MKLAFPVPHMIRLKASSQAWERSVTGADQTRMVKRAEDLGYDMIAVSEHFLIPNQHLDLSGPHYFHSIVGQAHFAGATERIRLNTALTILPLHNPIVLAKAIATADWLSSGRITVTFGVGWLEEEFRQMGVPFKERGRITDEYLAAMVELWTQDNPSFEGKYVSFRDVAFEPKPVQKPYIPIWMGGDAEAPLKRAARYASGWIPFLTDPKDFPARIDFIKSQPDWKGGELEVLFSLSTLRVGEGHAVIDDPRSIVGSTAQQIVDQLGWLKGQGVTMTSVPIPPVSSIEAYLDHAQWVIEEIKPKL